MMPLFLFLAACFWQSKNGPASDKEQIKLNSDGKIDMKEFEDQLKNITLVASYFVSGQAKFFSNNEKNEKVKKALADCKLVTEGGKDRVKMKIKILNKEGKTCGVSYEKIIYGAKNGEKGTSKYVSKDPELTQLLGVVENECKINRQENRDNNKKTSKVTAECSAHLTAFGKVEAKYSTKSTRVTNQQKKSSEKVRNITKVVIDGTNHILEMNSHRDFNGKVQTEREQEGQAPQHTLGYLLLQL